MTSMVERVARAMQTFYPNGGDDWGYVTGPDGIDGESLGSWNAADKSAKLLNARAAIEAMRSPTPSMTGRGGQAMEGKYLGASRYCWEAMVDEALREK